MLKYNYKIKVKSGAFMKKEKKSKKKRILALLLLIPFVLIIGTVAGVALPLIISYNNNAYEEVDIVERSDEYVVPETDPQPEEWADVTLSLIHI